MDGFVPGSLLAHLARIPDPRSPHGQRFPLTALLAAACAAILCGARSFAAIAQWARSQDIGLMHRLGFARTPPTPGAYRYLFLRLDAESLEAVLGDWIDHSARPARGRPTTPDADGWQDSPRQSRPAAGRRPPAVAPRRTNRGRAAADRGGQQNQRAQGGAGFVEGVGPGGPAGDGRRHVLPPGRGRAGSRARRTLFLRGQGQPGDAAERHPSRLRAGLFPPTRRHGGAARTTRRAPPTSTEAGSRCGRFARRRG